MTSPFLATVCVSALYEADFGGHTAVYWEVKYPFPLSNRDVSFRQSLYVEDT